MEPWLNTTDYGPVELILFVTGCTMWVTVYLIYVRNIIRHQFFEMPLIAAGSNFAWELLWGGVFQTDMGLICDWLYKAWFILDLYLIAALFKYSTKQFNEPVLQRASKPMLIASMLFFTL